MAYVIKKLTTVTSEENSQMQKLIEICNRIDKTSYSYFADDCFKDEDDINTFFLYDKQKLVSAISLFTPRSCETEVLAYTHPDYRKKGLFTMLIAEAASELKRRGVDDFLFVCDRKSKSSIAVLSHLGAEYQYSEYSMRLNKGKFAPCGKIPDLEIRPVKAEDREELARINSEAFHESFEDSLVFIDEFFTSGRRQFHTLVYQSRIAGMIGVYIEDVRFYLHGICVDRSLRGKGIGKGALSFAVEKYSSPSMSIDLDVRADNEDAFALYLKTGFEIVSVLDYLKLTLT
ncbi:MAG: GNAT family N-acetyltransferase [Spirochaetes bacterium]|nr:GNAT family N-acetyltransferase [Spirochaetota bacterium]